MAMRRVGSYAVLERRGYGTVLDNIIEAGGARFILRLHLNGGEEFGMGFIPNNTAEALRQITDETGDLYYILREVKRRGMNPFTDVRKVVIKTNYNNTSLSNPSY